MKLSTRSTYGIRAMVELGLASRRGPVSVALIAKNQDLSVAYLEQLLHRLKKRGLVTSIRGPKGGYLLSKDPNRITVADMVRILEGVSGSPNGTHGSGKDGLPAPSKRAHDEARQAGHRHAQRVAHAVFHCVHERLADALNQVTLQELCDEARAGAQEPLDHRYVFHI